MPEACAQGVVRELLREATERLAAAGVDTPSLDAELLLADALGLGRERLLVDPPAELRPDGLVRFGGLLERRAQREPVAYILGSKHFRWINVAVDRRVLIPRPETELLVEIGLAVPGGRVVDVGTGSGAVALALAFERPDLEVWGTDVSPDALAVARDNAQRLGLERVRFVHGDLLEGVPGPVAAVLANLPYVAEGSELAPEIERYEPAGALFAGPDGLEVIRRMVDGAAEVPLLVLEIGLGQGDEVAALVQAAGFRRSERVRDLAGIERVVIARR